MNGVRVCVAVVVLGFAAVFARQHWLDRVATGAARDAMLVAVSRADGAVVQPYDAQPDAVAFYPIGGASRAADEVMRRFRRFYPAVPVLMQSDRGDVAAIKRLAEKWNATHRALPGRFGRADSGTIFDNVDDLMWWFWGMRDAAVWARAKWILLLEDDVWVLRPISFAGMTADINGLNPYGDAFSQADADVASRVSGTPVPIQIFAGHGGTVYSARAVEAVFRHEATSRALAAEYLKRNHWLPTDRLASFLTVCYNGKLGAWPETLTWMQSKLLEDVRLVATQTEVLHYAKFLY